MTCNPAEKGCLCWDSAAGVAHDAGALHGVLAPTIARGWYPSCPGSLVCVGCCSAGGMAIGAGAVHDTGSGHSVHGHAIGQANHQSVLLRCPHAFWAAHLHSIHNQGDAFCLQPGIAWLLLPVCSPRDP